MQSILLPLEMLVFSEYVWVRESWPASKLEGLAVDRQ